MFSSADIISGILIGIYNIIVDLITHATKESVTDHIQKNTVVQDKLQGLLTTLEASRIYIKLYHNGGSYYTSMPQQKNSCAYEVVDKGIMPIMAMNQNKLVSESPILHATVNKTKEFEVLNVDDLTDEALKLKYKERGVKSVYIRGIWDIYDKLIGLLCVDYNYDCRSLTKEEKTKIIDFCQIMVGYLSPEKKNQISAWIAGVIMGWFITSALSTVAVLIYVLILIFNSLKGIII